MESAGEKIFQKSIKALQKRPVTAESINEASRLTQKHDFIRRGLRDRILKSFGNKDWARM
jgi:hypothetical protein